MTKLEKGYREVTCKECKAKGTLYIGTQYKTTVRIRDGVQHKESCSQFKHPQPAHFKNKKSWEKQEKKANELVGAHATVASGAVGEDGDGRLFGEWRVEAKQTSKDFYAISDRVWSKLVNGALGAGEEPILHVQVQGVEFVVMRLELYQAWTEKGAMPEYKTDSKRVSYRFNFPTIVTGLNPTAVAVYAHVFKEMKDAWTSRNSSTTLSGRSSEPTDSR